MSPVHSHPPRVSPTSGFTLIELLVVIAIISILCALLLPVIGGMREKANSVKCMNSLKQISPALFAYAGENNGEIPAASGPPSTPSGNLLGNWYVDLSPYLSKGKTTGLTVGNVYPQVNCPTFWNKPGRGTNQPGFGMNVFLRADDNNVPVRTSSLRQKLVNLPNYSRTVIVGETTALNLDISTTSWKFKKVNKDAIYIEGWDNNGTPDRHGDRSDYLFLDGHVEALVQTAAEAILKPTNILQ